MDLRRGDQLGHHGPQCGSLLGQSGHTSKEWVTMVILSGGARYFKKSLLAVT